MERKKYVYISPADNTVWNIYIKYMLRPPSVLTSNNHLQQHNTLTNNNVNWSCVRDPGYARER